MTSILLYTKRFELKFGKSDTSFVDITKLIEEVSEEYAILDRNPSITIENGYQYVTLKVSPKTNSQKIGFNIGAKG